MKYSLIYILVCLLVFSSCDIHPNSKITITPNTITVNSNEQDILFHTNISSYYMLRVVSSKSYTSEVDEVYDNNTMIYTGDWFQIEKDHNSTEVRLHLEENTEQKDRQLEFLVYAFKYEAYVTVTQSGAASLE